MPRLEQVYRYGNNDILWDEEVEVVREYVYYSIIRDNLFTLTTPPLHEAGEIVVGVLYLGEL
jgi:hypothetical protein